MSFCKTNLANHSKIIRISFAGKYLPPFHAITVQEISFKMFLTRTFLFVRLTDFQFFVAHLMTNEMLKCVKKIFNQHLNICKIFTKKNIFIHWETHFRI